MRCQWQSFPPWALGNVCCRQQPCSYLHCIYSFSLHRLFRCSWKWSWCPPQNAIKSTLWVQVKILLSYHFLPLSAGIKIRGREMTANTYIWVNTADYIENERMGELVLQEVRKNPILFNILLECFEDYFQAILSICTAVVPLMLK